MSGAIKTLQEAIAAQEKTIKLMEPGWHAESVSDQVYQQAKGELVGLTKALRLVQKCVKAAKP